MGVVTPYVPQAWVDNITPADAAHMLAIENGLATAVRKPTGLLDGETPVWDAANGGWERSSVKKIQKTSLGPLAIVNADVDPAAAIAASKLTGISNANGGIVVSAANTDLAGPGAAAVTFWGIATGGGTLRSIAAPTNPGARITIRNNLGSGGTVTIKHLLAGGTGAQIYLRGTADLALLVGEILELEYDGTTWVEGGRDVAVAAGGGVTVASTIAGLGTGTDGKQGRLRFVQDTTVGVGSGYELLDLVYDATLGKWVSASVPAWNSTNPAAGNYGTNNDGGAVWGSHGIAWKGYLAAGLTPQVKFNGMTMDASTSTNLFIYISQYHVSNYAYSAAVPNDLTSLGNIDGAQRAQTTANQWVGYVGPWLSAFTSGTPKEICLFAPQTSRATSRIAGTVWLRWVG